MLYSCFPRLVLVCFSLHLVRRLCAHCLLVFVRPRSCSVSFFSSRFPYSSTPGRLLVYSSPLVLLYPLSNQHQYYHLLLLALAFLACSSALSPPRSIDRSSRPLYATLRVVTPVASASEPGVGGHRPGRRRRVTGRCQPIPTQDCSPQACGSSKSLRRIC